MSPITIGLERRIRFINETNRSPCNELNQSEEEKEKQESFNLEILEGIIVDTLI